MIGNGAFVGIARHQLLVALCSCQAETVSLFTGIKRTIRDSQTGMKHSNHPKNPSPTSIDVHNQNAILSPSSVFVNDRIEDFNVQFHNTMSSIPTCKTPGHAHRATSSNVFFYEVLPGVTKSTKIS